MKNLGWFERIIWEEGLKKIIEWYISNFDWWGDVFGVLFFYFRMLMMFGMERYFDEFDDSNFVKEFFGN